MADDITFAEKVRWFDAALDELQGTIEAGGSGLNEMMDEVLEAAQAYRNDRDYRVFLGTVLDR